MYGRAIRCELLITILCPAFSKAGTGVDTKIGVGVDQEAYLRQLIYLMHAAG